MVVYESRIIEDGNNHFIELGVVGDILRIPITEDSPIATKDVFNKLIINLKKEEFRFNFSASGTDLYSSIGAEYITQLNSEMAAIRKELSHLGLLVK